MDWLLPGIDISFNPLRSLPSALMMLPNLRRLYCFSCAVTAIQDLGDMRYSDVQIAELYVGNNPLGMLPVELGLCPRLSVLSAFDCGLREVPGSFASCANTLMKVQFRMLCTYIHTACPGLTRGCRSVCLFVCLCLSAAPTDWKQSDADSAGSQLLDQPGNALSLGQPAR